MIRETPIITVDGAHLKLENLQRTGSFKLRGAVRRLSRLAPEERRRGVVAASAGNHGAGIAVAASSLGVPATVFVPVQAPIVKRQRIAGAGADVRVEGENYDDSERIARAYAADSGRLFISPFDDDDIIAGNGGSMALELLEQLPELERVIAPVGGGGLVAGLAELLAPRGVEVVGVEPAENCAMFESLRCGAAVTDYPEGGETVALGCEGAVSERTYRLFVEHDVRVVTVSEAAIREAVACLYRQAGQLVECSGAVAFAAWRSGAVERDQCVTAIVASGGNIDDDELESILAATPVA